MALRPEGAAAVKPQAVVAAERATMVAMTAMRGWRTAVQVLPLLAGTKELRVPLCGLVAWYERLCEDVDYVTQAPAEGLEVLPLLRRTTVDRPPFELVTAWWAVRVAEETVACRRLLLTTDLAAGPGLEVALSRLEIAMYGSHEHSTKVTA